jgi:thioredoxin 1
MTKIVTTLQEFNEILKEAGTRLVVVDFFASWCIPCKHIAPEFTSLEEKNPGVVFLKVDVDENSETAEAYMVSVMPTFIFFQNGKSFYSFEGADMTHVEYIVRLRSGVSDP